MTQAQSDILMAIALFLMLYAALSAWRFAVRLRSERSKRRKGIVLNLLRRAVPPVTAGALVWGIGLSLARPEIAGIAGVLVFGGLSYGLHRGLAEMRQDTTMLIALRLGASLGLTLATVWVQGGM